MALRAHIATKAPKAPVFGMPDKTKVAGMLRADLAEARHQWLLEATGRPDEYAQREQSDYLSDVNHEGEVFDFHCLRHTCGAWLAMAGVYPTVVQSVMRHGSITLTMDTCGHLFPGQESDAVARLGGMLSCQRETLSATGTDDIQARVPDMRAAHAQQSGRDLTQISATACDTTLADDSENVTNGVRPNPLRREDFRHAVQPNATTNESGRGGTRTRTRVTPHGILSPGRLPIPPLGQRG